MRELPGSQLLGAQELWSSQLPAPSSYLRDSGLCPIVFPCAAGLSRKRQALLVISGPPPKAVDPTPLIVPSFSFIRACVSEFLHDGFS